MKVKRRLALLLGLGLGVNVMGFNQITLAKTSIVHALSVVSKTLKTTSSVIDEISKTTSSIIMVTPKTTSSAIVVSDLDKQQLLKLINEAENLYHMTAIGANPGMCNESDKIAFEKSILEIREKEKEATTKDEIDLLIKQLEHAIKNFKDSRVPYQTQDINQDGNIDIQDLALVMYYYRMKEADHEWEYVQKADVNQDGVIDLMDLMEVAYF